MPILDVVARPSGAQPLVGALGEQVGRDLLGHADQLHRFLGRCLADCVGELLRVFDGDLPRRERLGRSRKLGECDRRAGVA